MAKEEKISFKAFILELIRNISNSINCPKDDPKDDPKDGPKIKWITM